MSRFHFANLDALRGVLAVYVILGHCRWLLWGGHAAWLAAPHATWEAAPAYASGLLRYGREAVMVFFVLSGFFIHYRAASRGVKIEAAGFAGTFFRRRAHRLVPPYVFALLVTVACDAIGRFYWPTLYAAATGDGLLDSTMARSGYSPASWVPAVLLLPSSLGREFGSNGPLWSLAFEAVYYALYPLWLSLRRRSATAAFVVVPLACLGSAFVAGGFVIAVLAAYPVWLAGAFLAERVAAGSVPRQAVAAGAVLASAGVALHLASDLLWPRMIAAILFGSGAVTVFGAAPPAPGTRAGSLLVFLGVRSYTIYIVHFPLLVLMSAYLLESQGARPLHGWWATGGAVTAVLFGCLCFEMCERHFLHSRLPETGAVS